MNSTICEKRIKTNVLVVGGGMAGFFAAIKAKERGLDVTLIDKGFIGKTGSTHFQGGDILFFRPERGHKLEEWENLISEKGEYLSNRDWVEICLMESKDRYNDLVSWGVPFAEKDGEPFVRKGFGYANVGIYEITGLVAGEYSPMLRKKVLESGVKVLDRIMLCELLKQDGKVVGAIGFHTTNGDIYIFQSKATVIATGSSSLKYGTHISHYWTGDGEAMAYRAGTEIAGKEFAFGMVGGWGGLPNRANFKRLVQNNKASGISGKIIDIASYLPYIRGGGIGGWFQPTLNAEGGPVISPAWEAHCGRAPVYVNFDNVTPEQLVPYQSHDIGRRGWGGKKMMRDQIGIDVLKEGGKVLFSSAHIMSGSIPGGSAGIWPIDKSCATGIPGLYAAGNSCATMGSGAEYVGMGFGLNHAAVTGNRAGLGAAEYASKSKEMKIDETEIVNVKKVVFAPIERKGGFTPSWLTQVLHSFTVPYFIFHVKHGDRLRAALTLVEFVNNHLVPKLVAKDAHELRMAQETKNMALIAEMMLRTSLFRTESRGNHYREDYPRREDPKWLAWVKVKQEREEMKVYKEPIPKKWWPDLSKPYEERYPTMFPGE